MSATIETGARSTRLSRHARIAAKTATTSRRIVLHADDFGMNPAVTDGILRGFDEGLLTSTSLLSNAPDADRAMDCWRQLEAQRREGGLKSAARRRRLDDPSQPFDFGIHLNLTQGFPLTGALYPAELLDREGRFPGIFTLFRRLRRAAPAILARVEDELFCQVQFMFDRGLRPTHVNGHQYIELLPPLGPVVGSLLRQFRIPAVRVAWEPSWRKSRAWSGIRMTQWLLGGVKKYYAGRFRRHVSQTQARFADTFFGTMTAGTTTPAMLAAFLTASPASQLLEIGLHPAREAETHSDLADGWHDALAATRPRELQMVLSTALDEELTGRNCRLGRLI
jgi:predicted glycoside hydrolase/deacetylase ChbG (UPF0249 family)